jgi:hypothetical protein
MGDLGYSRRPGMRSTKPKALVQGVDYYMDGGKFVFTATYHLKRGFCCNNTCRHCPYKGAETINVPKIQIIGLPGSKSQ